MRSLLIKLKLAYLRRRVREAHRDIEITQAEMRTGPQRLQIYREALSGFIARIEQLEQRL